MSKKAQATQEKIYQFILQTIERNGFPPTVREICGGVGLKSTASVHVHLANLQEMGLLSRNHGKNRAIEVLDINTPHRSLPKNAPLVGKVAAGTPILAIENIEDTFALPSILVQGENPFVLRVHGDSMIMAGIMDGDFVVVTPQETAKNGDIVLALLNDSATIKRYYLDKNGIRLQAENPQYSPIISKEIRILGRVTGLMRQI